MKAHFGGGRVEEVPATWRDRTEGASRFRLFSWLPHYLRWYFWALAQAEVVSREDVRPSVTRPV